MGLSTQPMAMNKRSSVEWNALLRMQPPQLMAIAFDRRILEKGGRTCSSESK